MRLKQWLAQKKITQLQFEEMSGIPQGLLSKYCRGEQRPHIDNALRIEEITGGEVPVEAWRKEEDAA